VVLLVDGSTRSGKEVIAHAFKRHGIGRLVGERTAGAVLSGRPFVLRDTSLLMLPVADVQVEGQRLEGVGVEPDVLIRATFTTAPGAIPSSRLRWTRRPRWPARAADPQAAALLRRSRL